MKNENQLEISLIEGLKEILPGRFIPGRIAKEYFDDANNPNLSRLEALNLYSKSFMIPLGNWVGIGVGLYGLYKLKDMF